MGNDQTLIIGHRGAARFFPENTMESFTRALEIAPMIEFDVHLSRDGVPVIIHDATLERTTDGKGYVCRKTFTELQALDAGYAFSPDKNGKFPFRGKGLKIPRLEDLFLRFPDKMLAIEIKENSPELTDRVMTLVRKYGADRRCVIGSKHEKVSETMRVKYPENFRFWSQSEMVVAYLNYKRGAKPKTDAFAVASMPVHRPCGLHFDEKGFTAYLHEGKTKVFFWTVNQEADMLRLAAQKVDGIITDDPFLAEKILKEV